MPTDSRNRKSQTESCNMTGGGKKYVGSILPGSIIHFLRFVSWPYWGSMWKNAEKKVRLIDKRKFGKMVDEEAKKRIKNTWN